MDDIFDRIGGKSKAESKPKSDIFDRLTTKPKSDIFDRLTLASAPAPVAASIPSTVPPTKIIPPVAFKEPPDVSISASRPPAKIIPPVSYVSPDISVSTSRPPVQVIPPVAYHSDDTSASTSAAVHTEPTATPQPHKRNIRYSIPPLGIVTGSHAKPSPDVFDVVHAAHARGEYKSTESLPAPSPVVNDKSVPVDYRPYGPKELGLYAPPSSFTQIASSGYVPYTIDDKLQEFKRRAAEAGIHVRIGEVDRSGKAQDWYYKQGRDAAGNVIDKSKVVTNAPAGESLHQQHKAFDADAVDRHGRPLGDKAYRKLGQIAKEIGLIWGGDFVSIYDPRHFELPSKLLPPPLAPRPMPKGLEKD